MHYNGQPQENWQQQQQQQQQHQHQPPTLPPPQSSLPPQQHQQQPQYQPQQQPPFGGPPLPQQQQPPQHVQQQPPLPQNGPAPVQANQPPIHSQMAKMSLGGYPNQQPPQQPQQQQPLAVPPQTGPNVPGLHQQQLPQQHQQPPQQPQQPPQQPQQPPQQPQQPPQQPQQPPQQPQQPPQQPQQPPQQPQQPPLHLPPQQHQQQPPFAGQPSGPPLQNPRAPPSMYPGAMQPPPPTNGGAPHPQQQPLPPPQHAYQQQPPPPQQYHQQPPPPQQAYGGGQPPLAPPSSSGPHMPPPQQHPQQHMPPPPSSHAQPPYGGGAGGHMPPMPTPPVGPYRQTPAAGAPPPQQPGYAPGYPNAMAPPPMQHNPGMQPPIGHHHGHHPQQMQPPQQQPQQQRRLDPDQMPNPVQVMADNQQTSGGTFVTNQPGLVPPLVTTKFITHDQGNSGPKYIRSSMYNVPTTTDMMKQTAVPFALIVSPFAPVSPGEVQPPCVNLGAIGPIRCVRCKAYMSPNMQFIDGGRRFQCQLCKATTEVPQEYFQHLDHTGQRVDKYERPELVLGTYEFVATEEYCRANRMPQPPALIFCLDVSYNNIKSGLVRLLCAEMKQILAALPKEHGQERSAMRVGFITYNSTVHFYNCKHTLAVPQQQIVGDVHEMFMPFLDGFLVDVHESEAVIDALMEQIPVMFAETRETETVLLPAIQAGLEALRAAERCGKVMVFHSSLPIAEAPGKLRGREDRNVLGTDKEKTVLAPQCKSYNELGQECVASGCSVDLFVFNNSYIDLATIGQVSRLTGGEVFKYTYFQADIDGARVVADVRHTVAAMCAFDTVMRVRTSTGLRPTEFYGHFFMSNTTDMEVAHLDGNKAVALEVKHDDKLQPDDTVYVQVAVLYTSVGGQRRLRVLNLALRTCTQMAELFRCCDLDVIVLYFAKRAMFRCLEATPRAVKEEMEQRSAQILACYRKNCTSPTSAGQLILPECMKLLPLYVSCLIKNDAIAGGSDMTCDDRSFAMQFVLVMDLPMSVSYFYPRLVPVHDVDVDGVGVPAAIRTTAEKLADDGAYVLENGVWMFVWLGYNLNGDWVRSVFGVQHSQQVDTAATGLPVLDNPLSKRVRQIVADMQAERPRHMKTIVIRQRDKLETVFRHYLIEDRGTNGAPSYVDYLCYLHKEIRALLS